ncbi:MAG: Hypothetical protein YaeJ with similarity to translation release factor, partial [uncultured Solirubrobacterales bacterium]
DRNDGRSDAPRARRGHPPGRGRAAHQPLVRSGRPARQRHRLAGRGRLRRGRVDHTRRGAQGADRRAARPAPARGGPGGAWPGAQSRDRAGATARAAGRSALRRAGAAFDAAEPGGTRAPARGQAPHRRTQGRAPAPALGERI